MSRGRKLLARHAGEARVFDLGTSTDGPPIVLAERHEDVDRPVPVAGRDRALAQSFRSVLADSGALEHSAIAVVNTRTGAGSGHVAAGLALAATSLGKRVVLVAGLIEPIAGLAAAELSTGLHSVITKKKPLDEVVVPIETPDGRLIYLPPGPIDPLDGLLAEHAALSQLINELKATSDMVIVELPPVVENPLAACLLDSVELTVLCTAGRGVRGRAGQAESVLLANGAAAPYRVHLSRPQPRPIFVSAALPNSEAGSDDWQGPGTPEVATAAASHTGFDAATVVDLRDKPEQDLVTVVIPCLNEEDFIDAVLESVQAQTHQNLEILVVDGLSDDRTMELVERRARFDARMWVVQNPEQIVSPGLNRALAVANGRWLVRIDAHCVIPPDYVERVVAHLATGNFGGVGGLKFGVGRTPAGRAVAAAMASPVGVGNSTYHHGDQVQEVEHIPFGAYPVALARELGGWDESVLTNQDFEFDHRVGLSGKPLLFDPDVVIRWHCRQSLPELFRQYRRYGQGKSVVCRLHPESIRPRHLIPAAFVAGMVGLAIPSFLLPMRIATAVSRLRRITALSYLSVLALGAATAKQPDRRAKSLTLVERLLVPAAFLAMHVGQGVGFWGGLLGFGREQALAKSGPGPVVDLRDSSGVSESDEIALRHESR